MLALVVVLGGCADDAGGERTSTTAVPTTTSTTTTMLAPEIEVPATAYLDLEPGTTYTASDFWAPFVLTVDDAGWRSAGSDDIWLHLQYLGGDTRGWDLDISIIAYQPSEPPETVTEDLLAVAARNGAEILRRPSPTTLAGADGTVFDLEAPVRPPSEAGCGGPVLAGHSRFSGSSTDVVGVMTAFNQIGCPMTFGVSTSATARIWVVDVDGSTITVIAAATNRDLFADLIPVAEKLLSGIQFDL